MVLVVSAAITAAAVLVAAGAVLLARRRVRRADTRVQASVDELTTRMEAMLGNLEEALSHAQAETERSRALGDLGGSIDLDAVLRRTLEAAASLPGVEAVVVNVPDGQGEELVRALGLTPDEAERQPLPGPPDGRTPRAVRVSYHYGEDELPAHGAFVYGGVAVPLPAGDRGTGSLAIFTRSPSHQFAEQDVVELEALARRAGPAVANALALREARRQADLDPLTRLHNRRVFHETLGREVARARRYDRRLSLIVFDVDDFKAVNERLGHLAADGVLAEVAERVGAAVRTADVACRVGGDEFAVIMPESTLHDGVKLSERLQAAIASPAIVNAGRVGISAGVAELAPGDEARSLFERADHALYQAKGEGKGRVVLAEAG